MILKWQCKKCLTFNEENIENIDIHLHHNHNIPISEDDGQQIIMELQCVHCGTLLTQTKELF